MAHYLLFATELYALPVLRPLGAAIRAAGGDAAWFAPAAFRDHLAAHEQLLTDAEAVRKWRPDAVFAASTRIRPVSVPYMPRSRRMITTG